MIKCLSSIYLAFFCSTFVLGSYLYTNSDGCIIISINLLTMLVSAYFIVRILDDFMGRNK